MKRFQLLCFSIFILAVSGCGSNPDSLIKEQIKNVNELASALENDAPQAELDKLQDRIKALEKKLEALDLSTSENRELLERHKAELVPAMQRLQRR